jgi:hypothetical protein
MKIITHYDPKPIPARWFDWSAIDDETYGGDPCDPISFDRHPASGRCRRKAPVADRGLGRLNWADTTPTLVASGTPAIDV